MRWTALCRLIATALGLAVFLIPGAASAHDDDSRIVTRVGELTFIEPPAPLSADCAGALFQVDYGLLDRHGRQVGTGHHCVVSFAPGCEQPFAGCRQTVRARVTVTFAGRGSVAADVTVDEVFLSENVVLERGRGAIDSGTGEFANASGVIKSVGTLTFSDTAAVADMKVIVRLRDHDDHGDDD